MINEQTVGAVRHASVPSQRIKTHEQAELDALTAEFLARGGVIKQAKGNKLDKKTEFVRRNNWEDLPRVLAVIEKQKISNLINTILSGKTKSWKTYTGRVGFYPLEYRVMRLEF